MRPLLFHSLNAGSMREGGKKGLARMGLDRSGFLCPKCTLNCDQIQREFPIIGLFVW